MNINKEKGQKSEGKKPEEVPLFIYRYDEEGKLMPGSIVELKNEKTGKKNTYKIIEKGGEKMEQTKTNQYNSNINNEKDKNFGLYKNIFGGLAVATVMGLAILGSYKQNQPLPLHKIKLEGTPKEYALKEFDIPTTKEVNSITIDTITNKYQVTLNPDGSRTYTGPINYTIRNPNSPVPEDVELTKRLATDTRHGSVTLSPKGLEEKLR